VDRDRGVCSGGFLFFNKERSCCRSVAKITKAVKEMDETQKDNLIDFIEAGLSGKEEAKLHGW